MQVCSIALLMSSCLIQCGANQHWSGAWYGSCTISGKVNMITSSCNPSLTTLQECLDGNEEMGGCFLA